MVTNNRKPNVVKGRFREEFIEKIYKNQRREHGFLEERIKVLIVCEGIKTEPNYFRGFHLPNIDLKIVGGAGVPLSVVKEAVQLCGRSWKVTYDSVWVLFDRDDFDAENVKTAFSLAKEYGYNIGFSNEAFELWYILHYEYRDTGMSRDEYASDLTRKLGKEYKKNSLTMYRDMLPRMNNAILNAKRLCATVESHPAENNPYTNIFELVEYLLSIDNV